MCILLLLFLLSRECDFPPLCSLQSTGSDITSHPLQIKMLTDRKRELEHRLSAMMEENDLLQGTVEELQDRVLILERQSHDKDLQVRRQQWYREGGEEWSKTCGLGQEDNQELRDKTRGRIKWLTYAWQQPRSWVFPRERDNGSHSGAS